MKILHHVLESIIAHSRESGPSECCGILLSRCDPATVDDVLPAENVEKFRPREAYALGHKAHLKAVEIESSGRVHIVGYYHSHPHSGSKPSERDTTQAVEGVTYLVIGNDDGQSKYAAWRLEGKNFLHEPLEVIE